MARRYDDAAHAWGASGTGGGVFVSEWAALAWQSVHLWRDRGGGALTTQSELIHSVRCPLFLYHSIAHYCWVLEVHMLGI